MDIRKVETLNSVWIVDESGMRFYRMPKSEAPSDHPYEYKGEWEEYTKLLDLGPILGFVRPAGYITTTSDVVFDSAKN